MAYEAVPDAHEAVPNMHEAGTAMRKPMHLLGVRVDDVTTAEVCARVAEWIRQGGIHQIATVNPEFIMMAQTHAKFREALSNTALNVPDGIGVLWAARQLGRPLRERVAGVDLMQQLCALAAQNHWPVFFLGAAPGVAEYAAALLAYKYPGLKVAGAHAGSPRIEDEMEIVRKVRKAAPRLLFVAYGAPAQDQWLTRNLPLLMPAHASQDSQSPSGSQPSPGLVGMGVGGALDFVTGRQQRAPEWMQRAGLEWFHRLLQQPQRWRRQLALPRFAARILLESFRARNR